MIFTAYPNEHAIATLLLTGFALLLFTRERIPLETSSLFILAILTVGFELFPFHADGSALHASSFFEGFGHEALIAVCALMVAGQGLVRTGALEPVGRSLARLWIASPKFSLLLTLFIGAGLSAFVNNTPIVVLLLPILISVSLKTGRSASGLLMPMGFATLVGGMCTTIGTSTNLLVVSVAADMGLRRFEMFDFLAPAALASGVGLFYLWLIAPLILPERKPMIGDISPRIFTAELLIPEESFADGKSLSDVITKAGGQMKVTRIQRDENTSIMPLPDAILRAGDRLITIDRPRKLKEFESALGATLFSKNVPVDDDNPLKDEDQQVAEIVVPPGSVLGGQSLAGARFKDRYQLVTLAMNRVGRQAGTYYGRLEDKILQVGDVLLVQGPLEKLAALRRGGELMVLDATFDLPRSSKAVLALTIMGLVVLLSAFKILPIAVSALLGSFTMIVTGCINWKDSVMALSTQIIFVVVASLALGKALLITGGADYVASIFVVMTSSMAPWAVLSGLMLLMAIITNIVSNNAAAVIGVPVAVSIARQLELAPEPFVMAVLFGANMSYATPMAYKTNLLVMNAGGYTFLDFFKVGAPLTLILWIVFSFAIPVWFGL